MSSVVERRLLVNYRVAPEAAASLVPPPMRPQLVGGWAVAGICLIRLGQLRPSRLPGWIGLRSENAAHRVAVEWDGPQGRSTGVYISRRDSGSVINVLAGGRLFPGEHSLARFDVRETTQDLHVAFASHDESLSVSVDVRTAERFQEANCSPIWRRHRTSFGMALPDSRPRVAVDASMGSSSRRTRGTSNRSRSPRFGPRSSTTGTGSRPAPQCSTVPCSCARCRCPGALFRPCGHATNLFRPRQADTTRPSSLRSLVSESTTTRKDNDDHREHPGVRTRRRTR